MISGEHYNLFQGRYKAVLVDADAYLLELTRYIHLNPVRAGLTTDPAAYRCSGHRAYLGLDLLPWLHTEWVLGQFAQRLVTCQKRYAAFVAAGMAEGHRAEFHGGEENPRVLGLEAPLTPHPSTLDTIVERVCARHRIREEELRGPSRARFPAQVRGEIGWLARQTGATTLTKVARRFRRNIAPVSQAFRRIDLAAPRTPRW